MERIFIGLCGRCDMGFESSGRGEGRWAMSLVRCLANAGFDIVMAPDTEEAGWGRCKKPNNVELLQAWEKRNLNNTHFDLAIFTSWQTEALEARFIHADKYIWGIMGWKNEVMVNGYFKDNEYVARWVRQDLLSMPDSINFKDRCLLLPQPFGDRMGNSKFDNKRVAWVAKEAFLPEVQSSYNESAYRHLIGTIEGCKRANAALSIFSCHEFDPNKNPISAKLGLMDKIKELNNVTMYASLPFSVYQQELFKCSITMPLVFAGSVPESIFNGLVPFLYKDNLFASHPWIKGVCEELTNNSLSRIQGELDKTQVLSSGQISDIIYRLLTDRDYYDEYLCRLRPMVHESLDINVVRIIKNLITMDISGEDRRK